MWHGSVTQHASITNTVTVILSRDTFKFQFLPLRDLENAELNSL
jgi:hypothetical protein